MPTINFAKLPLTGPSNFLAAGDVETITISSLLLTVTVVQDGSLTLNGGLLPFYLAIANETITITGGVLLGQETGPGPEDPVVYGTASVAQNLTPGAGLTPFITLTFAPGIHSFAVTVFNGDQNSANFEIFDNQGDHTFFTLGQTRPLPPP